MCVVCELTEISYSKTAKLILCELQQNCLEVFSDELVFFTSIMHYYAVIVTDCQCIFKISARVHMYSWTVTAYTYM